LTFFPIKGHREITGLTKALMTAWENRDGPVVFTTVDEQGTPNSIYAS
jgi:hypothetical protein